MISMRVGDEVFFYQSNVKQPSIMGIMKVVKEA
jgi:predicted RNA-binding protein with PUA-like domain